MHCDAEPTWTIWYMIVYYQCLILTHPRSHNITWAHNKCHKVDELKTTQMSVPRAATQPYTPVDNLQRILQIGARLSTPSTQVKLSRPFNRPDPRREEPKWLRPPVDIGVKLTESDIVSKLQPEFESVVNKRLLDSQNARLQYFDLNENSTTPEIEKAWKKKVLLYHEDKWRRFGNDAVEMATQISQKMTGAKDILITVNKVKKMSTLFVDIKTITSLLSVLGFSNTTTKEEVEDALQQRIKELDDIAIAGTMGQKTEPEYEIFIKIGNRLGYLLEQVRITDNVQQALENEVAAEPDSYEKWKKITDAEYKEYASTQPKNPPDPYIPTKVPDAGKYEEITIDVPKAANCKDLMEIDDEGEACAKRRRDWSNDTHFPSHESITLGSFWGAMGQAGRFGFANQEAQQSAEETIRKM